jgi:hypothetical protein
MGSERRPGKIRRKIRAGARAGGQIQRASGPDSSGENSGSEAGASGAGSGSGQQAEMVGAGDMNESTGDAPLSNEAADLLLEANAALAGAEPEALTQDGLPPPEPIDAAKEFREVLHLPVMFVTGAVLPQWGITEEFRKEWTEASAECLAQLFPDGVGGKYACWFRLIACTGIIAAHGIAQNGGKLPGIGPKKAPDSGAPEHGAATPA